VKKSVLNLASTGGRKVEESFGATSFVGDLMESKGFLDKLYILLYTSSFSIAKKTLLHQLQYPCNLPPTHHKCILVLLLKHLFFLVLVVVLYQRKFHK